MMISVQRKHQVKSALMSPTKAAIGIANTLLDATVRNTEAGISEPSVAEIWNLVNHLEKKEPLHPQ